MSGVLTSARETRKKPMKLQNALEELAWGVKKTHQGQLKVSRMTGAAKRTHRKRQDVSRAM